MCGAAPSTWPYACMQLLDQERVENEFLENVKDHVLLGTGDQVCDQIRDIAARLPIGPLLIRPHWPGMDAEQTAAYLELATLAVSAVEK